MKKPKQDITKLLNDWQSGQQDALNEIMPLIYDELLRISKAHLRREKENHTLEASALVNEVYMRMIDQKRTTWKSRKHFLSVAANLMRRILVDYWHHKNRQKRGGDLEIIGLSEMDHIVIDKDLDLLRLEEGLEILEAMDRRKASLVELKFFGGLSSEEIAEILQISPATVGREWRAARAWLHAYMKRRARGLQDGG